MTTTGHQHAILLCACGAVVAQCRCMALDKPRRVVVQQCAVCVRTPTRPSPALATLDQEPPPLDEEP